MQVSQLILQSRPRFWMYTGGPVLLASFATSQGGFLGNWQWWIIWLSWLFPANLFIYGVNDLYDAETDRHNSKKQTHERILTSNDIHQVKVGVLISMCWMLGVTYWLSPSYWLYVMLFLALSWSYSAPPCRLKGRPIWDFLSNVLYVLPGWYTFHWLQHSHVTIAPMLASWLWASGMHLFSAIPDIKADTQAHIRTTAVVLGRTQALLLTCLLWCLCLAIATTFLPWWLIVVGSLYPLLTLLPLVSRLHIDRIYWTFPWINFLTGMLLSVFATLQL